MEIEQKGGKEPLRKVGEKGTEGRREAERVGLGDGESVGESTRTVSLAAHAVVVGKGEPKVGT